MDNQIWNDDKGEGNAHINKLRDYGHGRIYIITYEDSDDSAITKLDPDDNTALLKALQSDNLFWRTTAQRIIVEGNKKELIPDLIELASKASHTGKDDLHASTLHALWTLDGLKALDGNNAGANKIAREALSSSSYAVKRAALALLPETKEGSEMLASSGLLSSDDPQVRLAAIVRASELPESGTLYTEMEKVAKEDSNTSDKWLNAAIKVYFRELNTEEVEPASVEIIVPSAAEKPTTWSYTNEKPAEDWMAPGFADTNWKSGEGMFGGQVGDRIQTEWKSDDIWLRKEFTLDEALDEPVIKIAFDDNYELYINGEPVLAEIGASGTYKFMKVDNEKSALFKKGKNLMAVHCKNTGGGQHIDVGIGKIGKVKADVIFNLKTVSQKMAYNKTELRAKAGQTVEIKLENVDQMPHNLVVIIAGSLDTFGPLVDEFVVTPDAVKMDYVPNSRYVLGATEMLDPGESGSVIFTLPDEPGTYPFVCTFPGHWRFMQGVIIVTAPESDGPVDDDA